MRPPICAVCGERFAAASGGTVRFTDFEPIKGPGHPKGLEWFCGTHIAAARALTHVTSREAVKAIRA